MTGKGIPTGRRLLALEDEFLLADDTAQHLDAEGAEVVDAVAEIDHALNLIEPGARLDAAVVIGDARIGRGIPVRIHHWLR